MLSIRVRNVNEALPLGMMHLRESGIPEESRGMMTLEYPTPVTTTYERPWERVLFSPERDANPFFHLFEALWIIGGRQDVAFLAQFNKRMADYSDNGKTFHAPYGFRLRHMMLTDQIEAAITLLREKPDTRQCVMHIWNADLDLGAVSKDIPCNDMIFLKIRDGALNMTVCCRSNDAIWGAYGANAVQFSMMQEYIADRVGVEIGHYRQVSDSFHVYTDNPQWEALKYLPPLPNYYDTASVLCVPLGAESRYWHDDLRMFLDDPFGDTVYQTLFFTEVVQPMAVAWKAHKEEKRGYIALQKTDDIDWLVAGREWMARREGVSA